MPRISRILRSMLIVSGVLSVLFAALLGFAAILSPPAAVAFAVLAFLSYAFLLVVLSEFFPAPRHPGRRLGLTELWAHGALLLVVLGALLAAFDALHLLPPGGFWQALALVVNAVLEGVSYAIPAL